MKPMSRRSNKRFDNLINQKKNTVFDPLINTSADLGRPKTRAKYNELLQRKQQIIDASKKLEQRPLLVKEKKQLLELNRKVLERVETEREKLIVSNLLAHQINLLKSMSQSKFSSEITGGLIHGEKTGIYAEALDAILKRHKRFKPGELEFILKTVNKSLIEVSKHVELLKNFNNKVDAGLYDATIRQLFKLYAENVFTAPKLVEAMKEMTTELKKTLSQPYPVGNPTGILMHFARKYKAKYPNL